MSIKIAINGFGRIGRKVARLAFETPDIELVAINDLGSPEILAHLLKYDSVHGRFSGEIRLESKKLIVETEKRKFEIHCSSEKDPSLLPWKSLGVNAVHECTGVFRKKEKASLHLQAGAQKVLISAPAENPDITVCMGVNHKSIDKKLHTVLSNASCTTNCLAPVAMVLDQEFGLEHGTMMTVHSYTNDQQILDLPHEDPRRARAAALSQIPTTTGAAKAVGLVLPHLKGKIDGLSVRVPTPNVSLVDFTCVLRKKVTKEEINSAFKKASQMPDLKGILAYSDLPLVSTDYNGSKYSATIDSEVTHVVGGTLCKVIAWYDNESGFSQRMIDLTRYIFE